MSLRDDFSGFKPKHKDVNCCLMHGGVGDHIGSLVAVNYILKNYKWINLLIWTPDYLVEFAKNVLPPHAIVRGYSAMKGPNTRYNREKTTLSTEWDGRTSPMKMHSVDYAFLKLCDEVVPIEKKNYLRVNFDKVIFTISLPEKYIVIATGFTAPVREFLPTTVNTVCDYILSKGYTPVFLGQKETHTGGTHVIKGNFSKEIDFSKGIDLRDQTTLLQAAKVIQGAKAIVGVDCGLLHVAGCTDTSIVAGFTTVRPELRAPIRNNIAGLNYYPLVPDQTLKCRFCQSNTNFLYDHDYKFCIYKDYLCVKQLTPAKFIEQLDKIYLA